MSASIDEQRAPRRYQIESERERETDTPQGQLVAALHNRERERESMHDFMLLCAWQAMINLNDTSP